MLFILEFVKLVFSYEYCQYCYYVKTSVKLTQPTPKCIKTKDLPNTYSCYCITMAYSHMRSILVPTHKVWAIRFNTPKPAGKFSYRPVPIGLNLSNYFESLAYHVASAAGTTTTTLPRTTPTEVANRLVVSQKPGKSKTQ